VTGVVAMTISGIFATGAPLPMMTGIAVCAALALALTLVTLKREGRAQAVAAAE
jgi:DHA1 family bicyclomycin/chloramphenicol resistance-like MFS transporter